jgi:hypothetical protein
MDPTVTGNPPEIVTVQEQFEEWRSVRASRRESIPQHLWQAAADLCREHSITQVSRQLRLSYSELKGRVIGGRGSVAQFVDIGMNALSGQWRIECDRADGSRLRMAGDGQPPSVESILKAFVS